MATYMTMTAQDENPKNDWRHQLNPGDIFVQACQDFPDLPCDIYCEVLPSDHQEDQAFMKANPHLRLCRCKSKLCKEGEVGLIDIRNASFELERELYEFCELKGFPNWRSLDNDNDSLSSINDPWAQNDTDENQVN